MLNLLILPLFLFFSISALTTRDNEIFDLQGTSSTDFLQEATEWQVTNPPANIKTSTCAGTPIMGGYQTLNTVATLQRTYTIAKPHNSVFIAFEAWMMGKWYQVDKGKILVKSASTTFSTQDFITFTNPSIDFVFGGLCLPADANSDYSKREMFVSSPHTGNSLTIVFQSATSLSTRTFGIRNIRIMISDATVTTPTQCIDAIVASVVNSCDCPTGQVKSGTICVNCDASCQSCFGTGSSKCFACKSNYYYDGTNCQHCFAGCATCSAGAETNCWTCETGYFMYPDGSCKSTCAAPYTSGTVGGIQHCYLPCNGQIGQYYYEDGICRTICVAPFIETTDANGAKFCYNPCISTKFYFPNGVCRSPCNPPFTQTLEKGAKYCIYPCGSSGDHYFDDGNCRATCTAPFTSFTDATGAKFCHDPCSSGLYYFPDGICRSTCNLPFTQTLENGAKYCKYPCGTSGDYYYWGDGICRSNCDLPFRQETDVTGAKFCNYDCSDYLYPNGTCSTIQCQGYFEDKEYFSSLHYKYCACDSPSFLKADGNCSIPIIVEPEDYEAIKQLGQVGNVTGVINSVGLIIQAAALPGDPGGVSAGALTRIIQYSKFLNISYPEKLVMMFRSYNPASGVVSLVPKMTNAQKSKFTYEPIPYNFMAYGVHSCFVVNFWNFMLFLLILLGICLGCLIMEKLFQDIGIWVRKVRTILQNFWIVQLYNSSGDILLFSIIQFRDNHWETSESGLNFLTAIFFLVMLGTVLAFHLSTLWKYQKARKDPDNLKKFEKNYECQQIFFGSFVDSSMNHQLFLVYFVFRVMLINLIIAVLTEYPLVQAILMTTVSLLFVVFIVIKRPFRSKIDLAQNLLYEVILLTVNITLLSFASLDGNHEEKLSTRERLAEAIITCSVIFTFLPLAFMVMKAIVVCLELYKEYSLKRQAKEESIVVKHKQGFVQRVEELRNTRRVEKTLDFSHQGLNIRKPEQFRAQGFEEDSVQMDLNHSSFVENSPMRINKRMNSQLSPEQIFDSSPTLYPLNHQGTTVQSVRKDRVTRNNSQHSPDLYPRNNNMNQIDQNTNSYLDSALDLTLPDTHYHENTMEREIEFIPNKSPPNGRAVRSMRKTSQNEIIQNYSGLERHPFHHELRNMVNNDRTILENINARNKRLTQKRNMRKQSNNSRKASDVSRDDEYQY